MSIEFSENFLKEMTETSERSKSNSYRLDEVENEIRTIKEENKAIHEIATSVKLIAQDMNYIKSDIATVKEVQTDLTEQVSDLKANPTKIKAAWVDKVIAAIIGAIGAGVLTFILKTALPNIF